MVLTLSLRCGSCLVAYKYSPYSSSRRLWHRQKPLQKTTVGWNAELWSPAPAGIFIRCIIRTQNENKKEWCTLVQQPATASPSRHGPLPVSAHPWLMLTCLLLCGSWTSTHGCYITPPHSLALPFFLTFYDGFWAFRIGADENILFRGVCINCCPLKREVSLTRVEISTSLCLKA